MLNYSKVANNCIYSVVENDDYFSLLLSSPVRVGVVGRSSSVAAAVARGAVGLRFLLRFGSV